jgi:DoxX-like family
MNTALWIVAGLLAVMAAAGGALKLMQPPDRLAALGWGFVEDFRPGTIKAIGILEILAAIGLILPAALDLVPILVPLAALGLVLLMVGAMITHLRRHEAPALVVNLVILALAAFVAWGRLVPESFPG